MPLKGLLRFEYADASFEDAFFVILGVPFDKTATFRPGAALAPNAIRDASGNFNPANFGQGVSFDKIPVHDSGDLGEMVDVDEMFSAVCSEVRRIVKAGKFPVILGGDHSVTPAAVSGFDDIGVVIVDAHLDFYDEYQGLRRSHASAHVRTMEHVGEGNVFAFGVRSISDRERDPRALYADSFRIRKEGCGKVLDEMLPMLKKERLYLSLDIDGIDPAYAPGTGTPQPFGLTPWDVLELIQRIGPRLVGFDVVEVAPPYDNGMTSVLAARLTREVMAVKWKALGSIR